MIIKDKIDGYQLVNSKIILVKFKKTKNLKNFYQKTLNNFFKNKQILRDHNYQILTTDKAMKVLKIIMKNKNKKIM